MIISCLKVPELDLAVLPRGDHHLSRCHKEDIADAACVLGLDDHVLVH